METVKVNLLYNKSGPGFTIVELLIVIVIIAVLASITVVAYNGFQSRAAAAKREQDLSTYYKALLLARESAGQTLMTVSGQAWSSGRCMQTDGNAANIEPKNLSKSHICWTQYYDNLTRIGNASGVNLNGLRSGDSRGNPYMIDENEGENGNCNQDALYYFEGNDTADIVVWKYIPTFGC